MTVPLPDHMKRLPIDKHGRPVPWFVFWKDHEPEFRVIGANKTLDSHRFELCWVCGQRRGRNMTFVIGPMCAVNRISAEPPSHYDCALYSALACPFLSRPNMVRRETGLPEEMVDPAGVMIERNPGVTLLWTTRDYQIITDDEGRGLFQIGEPTAVAWYAKGRPATHEEALEGLESGMPTLRAVAEANDGPAGVQEVENLLKIALELLPT